MTTTYSVGTGGTRTYISLQAAWNALPSILVDNYVFECYNDGMLAGLDTSASAKTMSGYTVTFKPAAGRGFRDNASKLTTALRFDQANGVASSVASFGGVAWTIDRSGVIIDGLQIRNTSNGNAISANSAAIVVSNCIVQSAYVGGAVLTGNVTLTNNVVITTGGDGVYISDGAAIRNNTVVYIGSGTSSGQGIRIGYGTSVAIGNASFGFTTAFGAYAATWDSSSDYNASSTASATGTGTHNLVSQTFANQFQVVGTAGSEDLRVKAGAGLIGAGVYNAAMDPDILGQTRSATTPTIGAFEYASADTTAPTLSSPTGTQTGSTSGSGTVSTNEANGTLYYLATTNATETASTVKAGASQTVTTTGSQAVTFSGLTPSTTYYAHYCHRDAAGNDSTVANSSSFTTTAATAGGVQTIYARRNAYGTNSFGTRR